LAHSLARSTKLGLLEERLSGVLHGEARCRTVLALEHLGRLAHLLHLLVEEELLLLGVEKECLLLAIWVVRVEPGSLSVVLVHLFLPWMSNFTKRALSFLASLID